VFRITKISKTMSDILNRGNAHDDVGPFESEGFTPIRAVSRQTVTGEKVLEGAIKIRNTVQSRGSIETDNAVDNACPVASEAQPFEYQYYRRTGPTAASHPQLEWRTIYTLTDDAPAYNSDEWNAQASELEIPERKGILARLVRDYYSHLENIKRWDSRGAHREELVGEAGVQARERQYDRALRYLTELPSVNPPATDGPAWTLVEGGERE